MPDSWFPDNTVLCNFAAVDRLDLLRGYLHGNGRIVEAVEREIKQSIQFVPNLRQIDCREWFGESIRITDDDDIAKVNVWREGIFAGSKKEPHKHLGESQTLFVISNFRQFSGAVWITDDKDAYGVSKKRGIVTRRTVDVFQGLVAQGELRRSEAFELCVSMQSHGRNLLFPPKSERDF